jgi:hypothetical protein
MAASLASYAQPGRDKVDERPRLGDTRKVSLLEGKSAHIDQNFENTLMGIVSHASSNFAAIKGKELESENSVTRYTVLRGVTGVKTASIVFDTVWRYEGVIYEDTSKSKFGNYYEEYAAHLAQSLPHSGYHLSKRKNVSEQLADYPDLSYRYQTGEVTIELMGEYSSINGVYSLTVVVKK